MMKVKLKIESFPRDETTTILNLNSNITVYTYTDTGVDFFVESIADSPVDIAIVSCVFEEKFSNFCLFNF